MSLTVKPDMLLSVNIALLVERHAQVDIASSIGCDTDLYMLRSIRLRDSLQFATHFKRTSEAILK